MTVDAHTRPRIGSQEGCEPKYCTFSPDTQNKGSHYLAYPYGFQTGLVLSKMEKL